MDAPLHNLIGAIHNAGYGCVFVVTGGGTGAVAMLLSVPGGSRSVLEAIVPYDARSLTEFLGHTPDPFCSSETARRMAGRALERARWLKPGHPVLGIACTASLRSDRPKRGDHRFHLALQSDNGIRAYSLTLVKEARDRSEEEYVLDLVLLNSIAEVVGVPHRVALPLRVDEHIQTETYPAEDAITALYAGRIDSVCLEMDGRIREGGPLSSVLLSGSFNPLHRGHLELAAVASKLTGHPPAFEISVFNADKPPLSPEEVRRRIAQFSWLAPVWLTRAPTFIAKAALFPETIFVVGVDTAQRILEPRFYGDSPLQRDRALEKLREKRCRFLVAARVNPQGVLMALDNLVIDGSQRELFAPIGSEVFRLDLCSTQLRTSRQTKETVD